MKRSDNREKLLKNIISLGSIDMLTLLIPIITMPILTRTLGLELYGQLLLFMTINTFGQTLIDYGVQFSGVRAISKNSHSLVRTQFIYSSYQTLRVAFSCAVIFLVFLYYGYLNKSDNFFYYTFCSLLYVSGYVLLSSWFLQGLNKRKLLIYTSLTPKIINLVVILFFVHSESDYNLILLSATLPNLLSGIVCFLILKKMYKVSLINLKSLKTRIISGWNVFLGLLAPNLYNALPIIFLGSTADPREYAKFAISLRICNIIFTLQNVLSKAIYPILSKLKGNNLSKVVMLNFIITAPCTAFLMIWGNDLLYIFLGYDLNSNIYLTIIPVSMIFVGIANSFSIGFFLPKSYDVVYRNISIRVSFISAAITYFLIMYFGVLGGAIGLLTARIILSSDYYFMYMKLTKLEVGFK